MSNHRDDFLDLDPVEARELEALAERLRADQPMRDDPDFFAALQRRIMNEVEVTPLPGTRSNRTAAPSRPFARLAAWLRSSPVATTGALAAAVAVLLAIWVMSQDPGADDALPTPDGPTLSNTRALAGAGDDPDPSVDEVPEAVPDELWDDGFLAYSWDIQSDAEGDELLALLEGDETTAADVAADESDEELGYVDDWGAWSLDELSTDELLALERALEG
jgi:hypothetical protein